MFGPRNRVWVAGRMAGAVLAVGLLAAACSSSTTSATSTTSAASSSAAGSSSSGPVGSALSAASSKVSAVASSAGAAVSSRVSGATDGAAAAGPAVVGSTVGALGTFLVDGNGMTLYMFDPDAAAPGTSTCYDACATAWPPLVTTGAATVTGSAEAAKLSTITRTDGSEQVVYGEYPLYYYAKDTAAGQTTGQAVGGKWWVVGVDGQPIKTPAG